MRRPLRFLLPAAAVFAVPSFALAQNPQPPNVSMQQGYFFERVISGFDFPTAIAFTEQRLFVAESGFMPPFEPKVKQFNLVNNNVTTLLKSSDLPAGRFDGPLTDVTFQSGLLWIAHRQVGANGWEVGAISKFDPANPVTTFTTVITNLPAAGDHTVNEIVFSASGRAYFSIGSATNSGVVGADNWFNTGWLQTAPDFHDFAPVPLVLNGMDYPSLAPFPLDPNGNKITGPYQAFGTGQIAPGTQVAATTPQNPLQGIIAGNSAVYSFDPSAGNPTQGLTLEGWGLRNPFGLAFDPNQASRLYISNNGCDVRQSDLGNGMEIVGSRPIAEDYDDLFSLQVGGTKEFFGWPDFFHDEDTGAVLHVDDPAFCEGLPPSVGCPDPILDPTFSNTLVVEDAITEISNHGSATKLDISTNTQFGFVGQVFQAQAGALPPSTGATKFKGFDVRRIIPSTGENFSFLRTRAATPIQMFNPNNVNKPLDVKFRGNTMLVIDFGVWEPSLNLLQAGTGKIWFVKKVGT